MPIAANDDFLKRESAAGILLVGAAFAAMVVANSPLGGLYEFVLNLKVSVAVGDFAIAKPVSLWVNDGLMAWFFFLVGLEIKREIVEGELSTPRNAALPAVAAVGGMAGPAAVYVFFNWGNPDAIGGWAIPAATDIAFALGILSLLGPRVPTSLKIFLTAVAIIDDIGAIIIIALFYTSQLSALALSVAGTCVVALVAANLIGLRRTDVYIGIGIVLWVAVLKSGVHATLAGAITALAIPIQADDSGHSPLAVLETALHGWVQYFILPVFAFVNAGLDFSMLTLAAATSPVALGIIFGLVIGKQLGVAIGSWLCFALGSARPADASPIAFHGICVLTGIGFTMSLFIGDLAFADPALSGPVKFGVLVGSLISAALGYGLVRYGTRPGTA